MRIRRVTAHAFGHLREQTLPLADGLTVVYGPNESGKSTWHAALLAALCGRWPGRARDEPGIERRRPWAGRDWVVSAEVMLADGRRVELRHDLEARHGEAKDLDLVADHAREITGSARGEVPDASRWLGLDRRAFVATACVRQSHLVLATEDASGVRGYVERAASTAPADETAAAALARIDAFQREHVGTERSTTRPLQTAQRRRAEADKVLRAARAELAELERQLATARELRAAADIALVRLRRTEAAQASAEAARLRTRAGQARELLDLIGDPADPAVDPETAGRASAPSAGLAPSGLPTAGSTATAISAAEVAAAVEGWRATLTVAPPVAAPAPGGAVSASVRAVHPDSAAGDAPASTGRRRRSVPLLVAAAVLVVAAGALLVSAWNPGEPPRSDGILGIAAVVAGTVLALVGAVAGAIGLVQLGRESARARVAAAAESSLINDWKNSLASAEQQRQVWHDHHAAAERRLLVVAGELGLASGPAADAVRALEAWLAADRDRQAARDRTAVARERSAAARARLDALLEGASITELTAAADRAQRRAEVAEREAAEHEVAEPAPSGHQAAAWRPGADPSTLDGGSRNDRSTMESDVDRLRREHHEADRRATLAEQERARLERQHTPVAAAEEDLDAAEAECRSLASLDDVLTRTRRYLKSAQERVHRDIAPRLATALARHLSAVTAGRYTEAVADPGSLAVRVRGPGAPLRDVETLSVGTAEQVYLLLRVALAEHLVRPGESSPLLLDDVTVHADEERTRRVLDVLLTVAERHQVILFTQQEPVRQWARATLTPPRHALLELTTLAPA